MIPHGEGFVIRHRSGRYFRSDCFSPPFKALAAPSEIGPFPLIYELVANPFAADTVRVRQFCGRFLQSPDWAGVAHQFEVVPRPGCGCCGSEYQRHHERPIYSVGSVYRCALHRDRNPCAITGCRRTTAAKGRIADDRWICSTHWRTACAPRSAVRRAYLRFFRIARKTGWTPELERRLERFWDALIKRARRSGSGDLDMAEINKLFGWAA